VADGRADEPEAAPFHVAAEVARERSLGRKVAEPAAAALERHAVHEAPEVGIEAAELLLELAHARRVVDGRLDLEPVADDPRIREQPFHPPAIEAGDPRGI